MFIKTSTKIKNYLTSVVTQKNQNIIKSNNLVIDKMKDKTCGSL